MPYAVLEEQIKTLPEEYLEEVANYVQLLQYKIILLKQQHDTPQKIIFGLGKGKFTVPDDIHAGDEAVENEFGDYL